MVFRTLLALSTGGLGTFGLWCFQDGPSENRMTVEMRATAESDEVVDAAKMVREMQELRGQLLSVLGQNHPAIRKLDTQILEMSAEGSLAENLFAPRIMRGAPLAAWSPDVVPNTVPGIVNGSEPLLAAGIDGAGVPLLFDPGTRPAEFNSVRQVFMTPSTSASEFGGKLAALRQKWTEAKDDPARQAVVNELKTTIATQFDADLVKRKQQIETLEKKLGELRKQVEKRESVRDEFVQNLAWHTEMEWEGISLHSGETTEVFSGPVFRRSSVAPESVPPADLTPAPAALPENRPPRN
jgi:hypothetical protein